MEGIKIRIADCHHQETSYIVTRFIIDNLSQFKNGQVVKRPDASAMMNMKNCKILNDYQEKLDSIKNVEMYSCTQLRSILQQQEIHKQLQPFKRWLMNTSTSSQKAEGRTTQN